MAEKSKPRRAMAPGSRRAGPDPPIGLARNHGTTTVFVGGSSRAAVNSTAFAIAELIDLTPFWLDVRADGGRSEGPDPGNTGWIPPDRLFVSEGGKGLEDLSALSANNALWTIVRSDEPASVLSHLTDFLRLPELIQEILSATAPGGGSKAVVVANSERVARLFPRTAEGLQQFLRTLSASSLSIVAANTGPAGPARFGFEHVFRVDVDRAEKWMEGTIVCEKGIESGPFALGRVNRLSDIPSIARVFSGLYPGPA